MDDDHAEAATGRWRGLSGGGDQSRGYWLCDISGRVADEAEGMLGTIMGKRGSGSFCFDIPLLTGMVTAMVKSGGTQLRQAVLEANAHQTLWHLDQHIECCGVT